MQFAVGFQLFDGNEKPFSKIVEAYREHISEVFFPWQDIPSGRSAAATCHGYTDWTAQARTEAELRRIKAMGIKLDLVLNANCHGQYAISEKLANTVRSVIDHLNGAVDGVEIVTTASPAIAYTVKKYYPDMEVRASVNMRIGTVKGMEYMAPLFDAFHVQRDYNRDLCRLEMLKDWADQNGKKLILLANSGCFSFCSGQTFHDNLVAHEAEVCEVANLKDFNPYVCWRLLKERENWHYLLENTWIRPEDLHNYEDLVSTVKLATRMHDRPDMVIGAYATGAYHGNLLDLFEPGFGRALMPYAILNDRFPKDWFAKTSTCSKQCHSCGYCSRVLEDVLFKAE